MLIKFETKSNRVKGLCFHHKRPWILASLHNGSILLYDYKMEILIHTYNTNEENQGPIRGIDFHGTQSLFVSGGDDYKIKIWCFTNHRCLFQLLGHTDYIRTVKFHHEEPFIVSSSDDQTIRIWNWQNRTCLAVLTGHNHYVMCAQFHSTEDLIVSASLDETVRVWDFTAVRKNKTAKTNAELLLHDASPELFGNSGVIVKHILEGHSRGVNWAQFHPKLPLIVSGADDRETKLWRMNDTKAWEIDTFRGHTNNVSCVMFHPHDSDILITNSEDKSIRIWDISKRNAPQCIRRKNDRYWILASHPKENLCAAGHDNGLIVFKLNRERPSFCMSNRLVYYLNNRLLRCCDFKEGNDFGLCTLQTVFSGENHGLSTKNLVLNGFNSSELNFLVFSGNNENVFYEVFTLTKRSKPSDNIYVYKGNGKSAVFISKNRFAVLDRDRSHLSLKNMKNEARKKIRLPINSVNYLFPCGIQQHIILRCSDRLLYFDIQNNRVKREFMITGRFAPKYLIWSEDFKYCAILSKFSVAITDQEFRQIGLVHEVSRIKSGVWDSIGVFVYTTLNHLKYCLPKGESGIIQTLDKTIYLTHAHANKIQALTRENTHETFDIDSTEYLFKLTLENKNYNEATKMIQSNKLVGNSIISYLLKKDFAEGALHFNQNARTKFDLAIECGDINIARKCAQELNIKEVWDKLSIESFKQGYVSIAEDAMIKTENLERLSFMYLILGRFGHLKKILNLFDEQNDFAKVFQVALCLGDVETRIKTLSKSGYKELAYLTAKTHNLTEHIIQLENELGDNLPKLSLNTLKSSLLLPPIPILKQQDWPHKNLPKNFTRHEDKVEPKEVKPKSLPLKSEFKVEKNKKEKDVFELWEDNTQSNNEEHNSPQENEWFDVKSEFGEEEEVEVVNNSFFMPNLGLSVKERWANNSSSIVDFIASGNFESAFKMLRQSFGIVNYTLLKSHFIRLFATTQVELKLSQNTPEFYLLLQRSTSPELPLTLYSFELCKQRLINAYEIVTKRKYKDALICFREILHIIPFLIIDSNSKLSEFKELIRDCVNYINALRCFLNMKTDEICLRNLELSCYWTMINLKPIHVFIGLLTAIKLSNQLKTYKTLIILCRRLFEISMSIELPEALKKTVPRIQQIVKNAENQLNQNNSASNELKIDLRQNLVLCSGSLTQIKSQNPVFENSFTKNGECVLCPFCGSLYLKQYNDTICLNCELGKIGLPVKGLSVFEG